MPRHKLTKDERLSPPPPARRVRREPGQAVLGFKTSDGTISGPVGRPPSAVAVACRLAFEHRIPLLEKIADGKIARVHEVATASGRVVQVRIQPTIMERLRALEVLGKAGRVMSDEPLAVEHPVASRLDFSKYTSAELVQLEALLAKGLRLDEAREDTSLPPSATIPGEGR